MTNNIQEIQKNDVKQYMQEDEIDLKELFNTILKYKIKIAGFSFIVILLTLIYVLSIPNSYKSEIVLSPQGDKKSSTGGLAGLASLAEVNLGGASGKDPFTIMEATLKDYEFNEYVIKKYNLIDKFENPENLVFAMGIDFFYSKKEKDDAEKVNEDEKIFNIINNLNKSLTISSSKESGLMTFSYENVDRFFAKELVDIYLKEMIEKIKYQDMKEIDKQIEYYNKELNSTHDVSLKEQLSKSLSILMQKRVFSLANDYYFVSKITDSRVSYIKDKTKPKRALVLVVSAVTSVILGIFIAFFLEFIRNNKNESQK